MDWLTDLGAVGLIVYGLAVFYTVTVLTEERGPFNIFTIIRIKSGMVVMWLNQDEGEWIEIDNVDVTDIQDGEMYDWRSGSGFVSQVLSCHRCSSFWVGLAMVPFIFFPIFIMPLAAGGLVVFLKER